MINDHTNNNKKLVVVTSSLSSEISQLFEARRCFIHYQLLIDLSIINKDWIIIKNNNHKTICQLVYDENRNVKENEIQMNKMLANILDNPESIEMEQIEKINSFHTLEVNLLTTMIKLDEVVIEIHRLYASKENITKIKEIFNSIKINRKYLSVNQSIVINNSFNIRVSELKKNNETLKIKPNDYYGNTFYVEGNCKVKIKIINSKQLIKQFSHDKKCIYHDLLKNSTLYSDILNSKFKIVSIVSEDIGLIKQLLRIKSEENSYLEIDLLKFSSLKDLYKSLINLEINKITTLLFLNSDELNILNEIDTKVNKNSKELELIKQIISFQSNIEVYFQFSTLSESKILHDTVINTIILKPISIDIKLGVISNILNIKVDEILQFKNEISKYSLGMHLDNIVSTIEKIKMNSNEDLFSNKLKNYFKINSQFISKTDNNLSNIGTIPSVTWDQVGGLDNVKEIIYDTIQLPLSFPNLFNSKFY
jgi:hypothetical protein